MKRSDGFLLAVVAVLTGGTAHAAATSAQATRQPASAYLETPEGEKPRVVITADPELDDSNSLVRYLLYSSDVRTEGLIYASSQFHWTGDGKGTTFARPNREYNRFGQTLCPCTSWRWNPDERFIDDAVEAYAKAYPNLRVHDPDFPAPDDLRSRIRWGNVEFEGDISKDTPGSDLIKALLLDDEAVPVYLHAWGGQSTIARALKSIEEQYAGTPQWSAIRAKVVAKAVIHASGDQDDTYVDYIRPHWPEIRYRMQAGGVPLSYGAQAGVSEDDAQYFTGAWTRANVSERGPLGAFYRVWGDGRTMVPGDRFDYFGEAGKTAEQLRAEGYVVWTPPREQGSFLGEGDTGTFTNLIDNGLGGYRGDSFGGWGGYRQDRVERSFAEGLGGLEAAAAAPAAPRPPARAPTHPFLAAMQRDFAARLVWATSPAFETANHNPRIASEGPRAIAARAGQAVELGVAVSDPDGDGVAVHWWQWQPAGSYDGAVTLSQSSGLRTTLHVPDDARAGDTIHLIAEATDDRAMPLTRYERFVIRVVE